MSDPTLPLTDLSPLLDKEIVARFDGGNVSSDGGLIVLREVERRTRLSARRRAQNPPYPQLSNGIAT